MNIFGSGSISLDNDESTSDVLDNTGWGNSGNTASAESMGIDIAGIFIDINDGGTGFSSGIAMDEGPGGADGDTPDGKGNGNKEGGNQSKNTVDNTDEATDHYYDGHGEPVKLGPNTVKALLTSTDFEYHDKRIREGKTSLASGNFSVDLTSTEFYVGRTNVAYAIECASGTCKVTYALFTRDGYWDPNFLAERTLGRLGIKKYQPDGTCPNLEFSGGTPYWFIPTIETYTFKDPGYHFAN